MPVPAESALPRPRLVRLLMGVTAILGAVAAYGHTLRFGFRWDDYHSLRPWRLAELTRVLHGSWDPTDIEARFYRPVSAWWYALNFEVFGLNDVPQHAISIAGMALAAYLTGLFVFRETGRRRAALVATTLYAIHPAFAAAQGVWLTNQMHLLASLTVLAALLLWQRARAGPARAWWPLVILQVIGFGIKEDLIVLTPVLLTITALRVLIVRDVRWPGRVIFAGGLALVGLLMLGRYLLLGMVGGYGTPAVADAWNNLRQGLHHVLRLVPPEQPWQPIASVFSTGVLIAGGLVGFLRPLPRAVHLFVSGLAVCLLFNLPFALETKPEQYHLLGLGAVLALSGSIELLLHAVDSIAWRLPMGAAIAFGAATFLPVTRHLADEFSPCARTTLETDRFVTEWPVVPEDVRAWLARKPAACRAGAVDPVSMLPAVTWAYGSEDDGGVRVRWTSDRAVTLIQWSATRAVLTFRRPTASPDAPVTVTIRGPNATWVQTLVSPEWQSRAVDLEPTLADRVRGMHRVDIFVTPAFERPPRDPASPGTRRLGVELRIDPIPPGR